MNKMVAVRMLEKLGCVIDVAADGRAAVAAFERGGHDIILMDCQMPVMDGFEATAAVRQREIGTGQRIPIVALTANAMRGDREECLAAGMDDYVSKPIQPDALAAVLDRWCPRNETDGSDAHASGGKS